VLDKETVRKEKEAEQPHAQHFACGMTGSESLQQENHEPTTERKTQTNTLKEIGQVREFEAGKVIRNRHEKASKTKGTSVKTTTKTLEVETNYRRTGERLKRFLIDLGGRDGAREINERVKAYWIIERTSSESLDQILLEMEEFGKLNSLGRVFVTTLHGNSHQRWRDFMRVLVRGGKS
jgi:hypothetical protein